MADEEKKVEGGAEQQSRRDFVKTSAQVAVTAPAVAMLLSATTKSALAQSAYQASASHILDDYTFGNDKEDIDAGTFANNYGNFNPRNGTTNLDDHIPPPA